MEKIYSEKDLINLIFEENNFYLKTLTLQDSLLYISEMMRAENNLKLSFKIFICELIQILVDKNKFCYGTFLIEIKDELIKLFYRLYNEGYKFYNEFYGALESLNKYGELFKTFKKLQLHDEKKRDVDCFLIFLNDGKFNNKENIEILNKILDKYIGKKIYGNADMKIVMNTIIEYNKNNPNNLNLTPKEYGEQLYSYIKHKLDSLNLEDIKKKEENLSQKEKNEEEVNKKKKKKKKKKNKKNKNLNNENESSNDILNIPKDKKELEIYDISEKFEKKDKNEDKTSKNEKIMLEENKIIEKNDSTSETDSNKSNLFIIENKENMETKTKERKDDNLITLIKNLIAQNEKKLKKEFNLEIKSLKEIIETQNEKIESQEKEIKSLKEIIESQQKEIKSLKEIIETQNEKIESQQNEIKSLKEIIAFQNEKIKSQ